jgi:GNAT superfamily N-acetyltransferase
MPLSRITRTESLELTAEDIVEIHGLRLRAADFFAEVGDVPPTVASLEADLADLPEGFARSNEAIYRGYEGDQLVGYAEVLRGWPAQDSWIIGILLVDSTRRGEGVGHEIAEAVALDARASGVRALLVGVIASRERSLLFWKREGYAREVLRRQLLIGDVEHEIIRLEREL